MSSIKKENAEFKKLIIKALNPREKPLDAMLARTIIFHTHRIQEAFTIQEARTFWQIVNSKVDLTLSCFTTWKFCNLLHRMLRDGHMQTIYETQCNKPKLQVIINYRAWHRVHMSECIALYCKMLLRKLQFHETYTFFKGNLQLTKQQQGKPQWDANICFQLCTDIFDLLEDLLQLQYGIFCCIQNEKISELSSKGKCRLMPLVTVTEECDNLYQHAVTALQMLYAELPAEDLIGLRDRFQIIFEQLSGYYENLNRLHFIREFLQISPLTPPYFYTRIYPLELPMPSAPMECEIDYF